MSNNSGDFFKGLSADTDPTKDLPPVEMSGDDVVEVEKGKNVVRDVGKSAGAVIEEIDAAALLSGEGCSRGFGVELENAGKRKVMDCGDQIAKRSRLSEGGTGGELHSRPKKLVSSRSLGMLNRRQVRQSQQIVYSSSSSDEYEENLETGEKRRRVGFFFKTAPREVLPGFLTRDDQWKLEGCSIPKRLKRAERVAGLVCVRIVFIWSCCVGVLLLVGLNSFVILLFVR